MSAQIDSKPTLIIPANQPLIFTISDTGSAPDRFVVWVKEDGTEIAKLYLTPNTNDKVHFNLAEVVRERVKVDDKIRDESATLLSYSTAGITTGRNGLKKYTVEVGTYTGTTESSVQDSDDVYLLDGAEQLSSGLHPSFADYYPTASTKKSWLTDREAVSNVIELDAREEDEGCIAFLQDSNIISGVSTFVFVSFYNSSDTHLQTTSYTITTIGGQALAAADNNQKLTYFMGYPKNLESWASTLNKPSNNPTWAYYTIKLMDGSVAQCSNAVKINKMCGAVKHENTQLAWTNSVGGWDSVTFTGRTEHSETTKSKPYIKQIGDWDASTYTFLPQARESVDYQKSAQAKFKLFRLDFSFSEIALIKYALRSDNVMIRIADGAWQPVIMDTKSYTIKEAFAGMFSVSLNVTLAQPIKC
jgi:hypothetical protein